MKWNRGKHDFDDGLTVAFDFPRMKLLHYRYLDPEYSKKRNAINYAATKDKGVAWTCSPDYKGEHSPQWVNDVMRYRMNVL